jgi:hypothetical protein
MLASDANRRERSWTVWMRSRDLPRGKAAHEAILRGVGDQGRFDGPARVIGGHHPERAGPFHPPRLPVEALPDEGAVAGRPPVLVDLLHAGPVERGEFAAVDERPEALISLAGNGGHQVDLLEVPRRSADQRDGRHGAVLRQQAQADRVLLVFAIVIVRRAGGEP